MYILYLVRHAEAEAHASEDALRALTDNGKQQAARVAEQCKHTGDTPAYIISSPALRCRQTAAILADALCVQNITIDDRLYPGTEHTYLSIITTLAANAQTVILVGHNPIITDMVSYLVGEHVFSMPTASCAIIAHPFDSWSMVSKSTCMWRQLLLPLALPNN